MLKSLAFLPAVLLVGTVPAVAEQAPQPKQEAQQAQSNAAPALDPNRKICKTEDLIGSRLGATRVCKTAAQWEAERQQRQRSGDDE